MYCKSHEKALPPIELIAEAIFSGWGITTKHVLSCYLQIFRGSGCVKTSAGEAFSHDLPNYCGIKFSGHMFVFGPGSAIRKKFRRESSFFFGAVDSRHSCLTGEYEKSLKSLLD